MANKEIQTQAEKAIRYVRPRSYIMEIDGAVLLRLEMPGVTKAGLSVNVEGDQLQVTGMREAQSVDGRYLVRERAHSDYRQTYTLDETVDRERIEAEMANGVLTLTLHLREEVKPRKIQVKTT